MLFENIQTRRIQIEIVQRIKNTVLFPDSLFWLLNFPYYHDIENQPIENSLRFYHRVVIIYRYKYSG
jgi:hypothetical protein